MTGTTLGHDWDTTGTREEIYKEIVSAVKELHIAFGAGKDTTKDNCIKTWYYS